MATKALQDAFREAEKLPDAEQDQFAAAIRAEIEAPTFTRLLPKYLTDDEYPQLQLYLAAAAGSAASHAEEVADGQGQAGEEAEPAPP